MKLRPLPRSFFARDPRRVARDLVGKLLIRNRGKKVLAGRIVEVEAYLGSGDPAAHAAAGLTRRNQVLFGPPGHAYVYFIYGNHFCLNVSCQPKGEAGCVLIRALEPLAGQLDMARARGLLKGARRGSFGGARLGSSGLQPRVAKRSCRSGTEEQAALAAEGTMAGKRQLTNGPGRLCQALRITRSRDNGKDLTQPPSGLWLADDGFRPRRIRRTPRIGIKKATEEKLRYIIADNTSVSGWRRASALHKGWK